MIRLKSQVALEYLVTYGWALIAILLTLGGLYYTGILDFSRYLPERCLFSTQFECVDFVMKDDGINPQIMFRLTNNLNELINVQSVSITNDAIPPLSCTYLAPPFNWDAGDEVDFLFTSCSGGGFIKNERVEAKITLSFFAVNTPSNPIHTINGKIESRVQ